MHRIRIRQSIAPGQKIKGKKRTGRFSDRPFENQIADEGGKFSSDDVEYEMPYRARSRGKRYKEASKTENGKF